MLKHNKLKNSGLLFELLVRQVATDALSNKDSEAVNILKKYFYNTDLLKEYKIYKTLATAKNQSEIQADILINACVESYKKLNKKNLREQKYNLIAEVKKNYKEEDFFKSKVDNYKILASVYLLLEMQNAESINPKQYSDCKITLLEHITVPKTEEKDADLEKFASYDKGTRSLIYNMFLQKLQEKYETLDVNQKSLLREYINNISTSDKLRLYCNEQVKIIKEEVAGIVKDKEKDSARKVKLLEISSFLNDIPVNKSVSDADINNMLYYYELLKKYKDA